MTAPRVFDYKSREWKALRARALSRARYRCENCGRVVAGKHQARVDHRIEVRVNPALAMVLDNLRVLCVDCDAARHADKGNRNVPRQRVGLDGYPF